MVGSLPVPGAAATSRAAPVSAPVTVSTFNLLCPAYYRVDEDRRESEYPERYLERQGGILSLQRLWNSDIICCQEFWYSDKECFQKYVDALRSRFFMHGLQRQGGIQCLPGGVCTPLPGRPDGLFMAISREWEVLHEADLDFEDAAGRCAQLLHLRRPSHRRPSELLVANVHLLFPHNEGSSSIRVREAHKLLSYIEEYKQTLAVVPPALICGDLNGTPDSVVLEYLKGYSWSCSLSSKLAKSALDKCWVSHRSHERRSIGVDYILLQNPSERRVAVADWTDHVFSEIAKELLSKGFTSPAQAWDSFIGMTGVTMREASRDAINTRGFRNALDQLGFGSGSGLATLTEAEISLLISSTDANDGFLGRREWCARFQRALERLGTTQLVQDSTSALCDLDVSAASLWPSCLEEGRWPSIEEWPLSDHGLLSATFELSDSEDLTEAY